MEEVFDITDTAVLVLEELVMWSALTGHTVSPQCDPDPPANSRGLRELSALGELSVSLAPPVNTSQHALIPSSPKVTLLGLQLASRLNLPHALLSLLFPNSDMEFRAGASAGEKISELGPRAAACAAGFHGTVPAGPHGPSSFTVTALERKRSKQTCGGRESLT